MAVGVLQTVSCCFDEEASKPSHDGQSIALKALPAVCHRYIFDCPFQQNYHCFVSSISLHVVPLCSNFSLTTNRQPSNFPAEQPCHSNVANQASNEYTYFSDQAQSPAPNPADFLQYIPDQPRAPVANMTGTENHEQPQQRTISPAERERELDTRMNASADKANEKRDRDDADFDPRKTAGKKRVGSSAGAVGGKRPKHAAQTAPASGMSLSSTVSMSVQYVPTNNCEDEDHERRHHLINDIKRHWGANILSWPTWECSPKTNRGLPLNLSHLIEWPVELLEPVLTYAQNVRADQHETARKILRGVIQARVNSYGGESTMTPRDLMHANHVLLQQRTDPGPSPRSPTFVATTIELTNADTQRWQPTEAAEQRHSHQVSDDDPNSTRQSPGPLENQTQAASSNDGPSGSRDNDFIQRLIYCESLAHCKKHREMVDEIIKEKERHDTALSELAKRYRLNE